MHQKVELMRARSLLFVTKGSRSLHVALVKLERKLNNSRDTKILHGPACMHTKEQNNKQVEIQIKY